MPSLLVLFCGREALSESSSTSWVGKKKYTLELNSRPDKLIARSSGESKKIRYCLSMGGLQVFNPGCGMDVWLLHVLYVPAQDISLENVLVNGLNGEVSHPRHLPAPASNPSGQRWAYKSSCWLTPTPRKLRLTSSSQLLRFGGGGKGGCCDWNKKALIFFFAGRRPFFLMYKLYINLPGTPQGWLGKVVSGWTNEGHGQLFLLSRRGLCVECSKSKW